jgi:hypothetical protein
MGAELPQDGELPGRTTGYWILRQASNPFPSPAPQFGQCEKMESSVITGLNAARLNCSNNCAIRAQQWAAFDITRAVKRFSIDDHAFRLDIALCRTQWRNT